MYVLHKNTLCSFKTDASNWKRLWGHLGESVVLKCIEHLCWSTLLVHACCGNPITYSTVHMYYTSNKILEHASRISENASWRWNYEYALWSKNTLHYWAKGHTPMQRTIKWFLCSVSFFSSNAQLISVFSPKVIQLIKALKILFTYF